MRRALGLGAVIGGILCAAGSACAAQLVLVGKEHPIEGKSAEGQRINDLCVFEGRLYAGSGDASVNTGPTAVLSRPVDGGAWKTEAVLPEESINRFCVLDGTLVVPGHDATGDWSAGNVHVLEDGSWITHRSIPGAIHVLDIVAHDGAWYAATGSRLARLEGEGTESIGTIVRSDDRGETWEVVARTAGREHVTTRLVQIEELGDRLIAWPYAHGLVPPGPKTEGLVEPYMTRVGAMFVFRFGDPIGRGAEAFVQSGGGGDGWDVSDILPTLSGVSMIRSVSFEGNLVLCIEGGGDVPGGRHLGEGMTVSDFGIRSELWTLTNEGAQRSNLQLVQLADIEVMDSRLLLLDRNEPGSHRWRLVSADTFEGGDVAETQIVGVPAEESEPRAIAAAGDRVWIGYTDGTVAEYRLED